MTVKSISQTFDGLDVLEITNLRYSKPSCIDNNEPQMKIKKDNAFVITSDDTQLHVTLIANLAMEKEVLLHQVFEALKDLVGNKGTTKSFIDVVDANSFSILALDSSTFPIRKGNIVSIHVNKEAYLERLRLCQFSLITRVVRFKGEKPWKIDELKDKFQTY